MPDSLKNKSYKTYDYTSRYTSFPYYYNVVDNKYIYGVTSNLELNDSYVEHKVEIGDSLDSLSLKYYNAPTLYWVIADYNRINDPFKPLSIGDVLKVPVLNNISFKN